MKSLRAPQSALAVTTLLLASAFLQGCATRFQFSWIHRNEPIPRTTTAALGETHADLQTCLDQLGAPLRVWESPQGIVLTYGWLDQFYWQFEVVLYGTGSSIDGRTLFSYNSTNNGYDGAVLVFDDALSLKYVRFGKLSDITRDLPRRPALID